MLSGSARTAESRAETPYDRNAEPTPYSISKTAENAPANAGTAYVRYGKYEISIKMVDKAEIIPHTAAFFDFFIASAAADKIAAHTFAATVGAYKPLADIAGGAAAVTVGV